MTIMGKREIRISIFYTDLYVWDFMRRKAFLESFLKQANDFYGKYKLRIDPFPFPWDYTLYKNAFVLSTGKGFQPDVNQDQLAADMRADTADRAALQQKLADPNLTVGERAELVRQGQELDKRAQGRIWQGSTSNGEYDLRLALGKRFASDKTLKSREAEFRKTPRLVIVFCEFVSLQVHSQTSLDAIGMYIDALSQSERKRYAAYKKPVPAFEQSFVIIDISGASWHTLAHEIAHGNGHAHPTSSYGGYYDGPQESIYNYFSSGMDPSKVVLEDADLKSLENAYFVR
ncbi:MAG: hypothetical protein ACRC20_04940 [Segniliparus sp.]|uniref:hypothetical protein n=1 Tax=Segniliparus sp. TaxID=2804064 RepID=UPI003F39ACBA